MWAITTQHHLDVKTVVLLKRWIKKRTTTCRCTAVVVSHINQNEFDFGLWGKFDLVLLIHVRWCAEGFDLWWKCDTHSTGWKSSALSGCMQQISRPWREKEKLLQSKVKERNKCRNLFFFKSYFNWRRDMLWGSSVSLRPAGSHLHIWTFGGSSPAQGGDALGALCCAGLGEAAESGEAELLQTLQCDAAWATCSSYMGVCLSVMRPFDLVPFIIMYSKESYVKGWWTT